MKLGKRYVPEESIYPLLGVNTLDPSTQGDHHTSPNTKNMVFTKGIASKRTGYSYLGSTLSDPVIGVTEFEDLNGTKTLLAFTTKKQYKFDTGTQDWVNITHQSAGVDVDWTGDEEDTLDFAVCAGLDSGGTYTKWVIITNGVDKPRYWDGSGRFKLYSPTGITGFTTCKTITAYYNYVVMGNVTTASDNHSTVFWSNAQKLDDFSTATVDGDTGAGVIPDVDGDIVKLMVLGDRCYIYTLNTIHSMMYVGGAVTMTFMRVLAETRLLSSRSITNVGQFHLFMSQENVVLFDGTSITREIGDRIYRGYRDELYSSKRYFAFAFHDPAKRQVYFAYPTATDVSQIYNVEYQLTDMQSSSWTKFQYNERIISMGFFSRNSDLHWDSAQIAGVGWNQLTISWAQGSIKGGFPVKVAGTAGGRVLLLDDTAQNDQNTAIDSWFDTMDYTVPQSFLSELGRWIEVEMELRGFECDVYYSKDEGQTYTFVKKLDLTSEWKKYKIFVDVMSRTFRIRLRNQCPSSWLQYRWIRVWVTRGGAG